MPYEKGLLKFFCIQD